MTEKTIRFICDICHREKLSNDKDYTPLIKSLLEQRTPKTRKILKKVYSEISKIPSQSSLKAYYDFLYTIKDIDNILVYKSCDSFLRAEYHTEGKGYRYLYAIIDSENRNKDMKIKYEKLKYGSIPPKKRIDDDSK